jgi:hypothetical protein
MVVFAPWEVTSAFSAAGAPRREPLLFPRASRLMRCARYVCSRLGSTMSRMGANRVARRGARLANGPSGPVRASRTGREALAGGA